MFDNKELAEYLYNRISTQDKVNTTFHLIKVPSAEELEFWIQQFKTRKWEGHTEWNETYKINVWVSDLGDKNEKKTIVIKKKNR